MASTTTEIFFLIMALSVVNLPSRLTAESPEPDHFTDASPNQNINLSVGSIAEHLRRYADNADDFTASYPRWKSCREENLGKLDKAIEKLDGIHHKSNIAQLTASVGGVFFGCVGIAGAFLMRRGDAASLYQLTESVGTLSSNVLGIGASVTEAGFSKSYIDEVRRLIEEDNMHFAPIRKWFAHSPELMSAIEEFCGFDAMQYIFQKLANLDPEAKNLASQVKEMLRQIQAELYLREVPFVNIEQVIELCVVISRSPRLLQSIAKINNMFRIAPMIFPLVKGTMLVPNLVSVSREILSRLRNKQNSDLKSSSLNRLTKNGAAIKSASHKKTPENGAAIKSSFGKRVPPKEGSIKSSPTQKEASVKSPVSGQKVPQKGAITYGIFQGANVASELFSVYNLVNDINDGSTSPHSYHIKQVRDLLELELDLVSDVYEKFQNRA